MYASKRKDVDEKLLRNHLKLHWILLMNDSSVRSSENRILCGLLWMWTVKDKLQADISTLVWFIVSVYTKDANCGEQDLSTFAYSLKQKNGNKLFWLFSDLFVCSTKKKKSFSERSPHFANFCGYLLLKESYVWISIHLFNSVIYYFFRCQPVGSLG